MSPHGPRLLPRLDTTPTLLTRGTSPSSSLSASPIEVEQPLLSHPHSPPATRHVKTPTRRRGSGTVRICLALVFAGIVLVTWSMWEREESTDELTTETNGSEGQWKSQLESWRAWALAQTSSPSSLGWGWNQGDESTGSEEQVEGDRPGRVEEESSTSTMAQLEEEEGTQQEADTGKGETLGNDVTLAESETTTTATTTTMNVRPFARPPSKNPQVKYLSFDNHSGFHNQRKSLVNALVLARLLNRTLLLPPARLGTAIPWGPSVDLSSKLVFSEECKAGLHPLLPVAPSANSHLIAERIACDDANKWTYVGWSWLIDPSLFAGRSLVDRWNSSSEWFVTPLDQGGLGLREEDIHQFDDDERRSYQIYDERSTSGPGGDDRSGGGLFKTRIDLEDLLEDVSIKDKRLLRFGSLFSGSRLNLAREENQREYEQTFNSVILGNQGLEAISDQVRDRLGSYVAIHARTGSQERASAFWKHADSNMVSIFRKLTHSVLGIKAKEVDRMVNESSERKLGGAPKRLARRSHASHSSRRSILWEEDPEEEDIGDRHEVDRRSTASSSHRARAGRPARPLASSLHCRKPLWPTADPTLARLNTPLYIATDSRSPSTEPSLRIFFDWFPCIFVLSDFISPTAGISDESVSDLARLARGGEDEWVSDFDGSEMAKFLYPFLEAEIAARGVETVGTPGSTFSGYTAGILHQHYEEKGILAPWNNSRR
ncbi:hypothetical protein JCM11491_000451 [Sporobolomyces phaffii]